MSWGSLLVGEEGGEEREGRFYVWVEHSPEGGWWEELPGKDLAERERKYGREQRKRVVVGGVELSFTCEKPRELLASVSETWGGGKLVRRRRRRSSSRRNVIK